MTRGRLEAFSDGVLAIILTIMVLSFQTPKSAELSALTPLVGPFLGYVLSFLYIGIYWNNHHHLFAATKRVSGAVLWANLHLLFWLSLVPFATSWMTATNYAQWPVIIYGIPLLGAAIAYYILILCLLATHKKDSTLALALGRDFKGKISLALLRDLHRACLWPVPDRRIEARRT